MQRLPKNKVSESEFQQWVLDAFAFDDNILLWRSNTGVAKIDDKRFVRFGKVGQADLTGIVKHYLCPTCQASQNGVRLEIELKVGKNKPTEYQMNWLKKMAGYNAITMILYPTDDDPIQLRKRVTNMILSMECPKCVEKDD
jgi:hypothetical protein